MSELFIIIASKLYDGEYELMPDLIRQGLEAGLAPGDILKNGLVAGMDRIGTDFKSGELFVPEVLIAARAMTAGMNILRPLLGESGTSSAGKYVIGTVKGDIHDIGKNLVRMLLEGAGFETVDLGCDVAPEAFVEAVKEHQPRLIGMSAMLTTTMISMGETMDLLNAEGLRRDVKVMIGGAPVTSGYAQTIGADAYAPDAASAVDIARSLIEGSGK
jgi:5-methyltetrahydrofolate--homocysteine methyltransferase